MKRLSLLLVLLSSPLRAEELPPHALRRFQATDTIPRTPVAALAFKSDGKTLLMVADGHLHEWDFTSQKATGNLAGPFSVMALSPDCRLAAIGTAREIEVRELSTATKREGISILSTLTSMALSPDASLVAGGNDECEVELWESKTGKHLRRLEGHDSHITTVAFSPSGKVLVSGSQDRTIRLWDPRTGKMLRVLEGHRDQVSGLVILPGDRTLVSASWDGTIRLWDLTSGKERQCLKGHRLSIMGLAIDATGKKLASASLDGTARVWDLDTGKETLRIDVSPDGVHAVSFSSDGKMLAVGGTDSTVSLWDMKGKCLHRGPTKREATGEVWDYVQSVAISRDGTRIVSGHEDTGIRLWDAATGKMIRRVGRMTDSVWSVQFSPDGKSIASAARRNGAVHIWDADKGELVKVLKGQNGAINKILYCHDGKRLIAAGDSFDSTIRVWDVECEKVIHRLEGHSISIEGIALSPDEKTLASTSRDGTLRLWDLTTGKEMPQLEGAKGAKGENFSVAFAPDGKTLAVNGLTLGLRFWDLSSRKPQKALREGGWDRLSLNYSRLGRTLVITAAGFPDIVLLDTLTNRTRGWLTLSPVSQRGDSSSVTAVAFSEDSRRIVTGDSAGGIILWDPTGLHGEDRKKVRLNAEELERRWQDLGGQEHPAYQAIWKLSMASEQSLPLFAKHLQPFKKVDPKQIERWVEDLGSDQFKTRNTAETDLEKLGELAQPALERSLKKAETLDLRRRIERVLERVASQMESPETLRQLRMVETLEIVGGAEARRLLERLATGDPGARLTREAKASLTRLPLR